MRVVTPGTVTDEALLHERRETPAAGALARGKAGYGFGLGRPGRRPLLVNEVDGEDALEAELARLEQAELLVPDEEGWPEFLRQRIGLRRRAPWHSWPIATVAAASCCSSSSCTTCPASVSNGGGGRARAQSPPAGALLGYRRGNPEAAPAAPDRDRDGDRFRSDRPTRPRAGTWSWTRAWMAIPANTLLGVLDSTVSADGRTPVAAPGCTGRCGCARCWCSATMRWAC